MEKEYEKCLRCGRKLKRPEARKVGMGEICWRKYQKEAIYADLFEMDRKDNNTNNS